MNQNLREELEPKTNMEPASPAPNTEAELTEASTDVDWEKEAQKWQAEAERWKDQALRALAELENYRRRVQRDLPQQLLSAQAEVLKAFLPALDNVQRALTAAEASQDLENLKAGLRLSIQNLQHLLQKVGITLISPQVGDLPDPHLHEVLSTMPAPEGIQPHTILEVVEPGYQYKGMLLRPARIIVTE